MKKYFNKYRSIMLLGGSLVFNLVSSLMVYRPKGVVFNKYPLTHIEYVCDIISVVGFFFGVLMMLYDSADYQKKRLKEAILEAKDEIDIRRNSI